MLKLCKFRGETVVIQNNVPLLYLRIVIAVLHVIQNCCLLCHLELAFIVTDVQGILVVAPMLEVFAEVRSFELGLFPHASHV